MATTEGSNARVLLKHMADVMTANVETFAAKSALEDLETKVDGIEVPEKVSELTNDSGYQTAAEVASAIADASVSIIKPVTSLDDINVEANDADRYLYLVPRADEDGEDGDLFDEYAVVNGALEKIGTTKLDLSGYVQKETGKGLSSNDFTDAYKQQLDDDTIATDAQVQALINDIYGVS